MFDKPEDERDEAELVKQVKPLLQQAEQILNETNGMTITEPARL